MSDYMTCLMWEQKTGTAGGAPSVCPGGANCASVHDVDNVYAWSNVSPYNDGPAFLSFLAELNGPSPFAGYDDWRLPTITELQSIVDLSATGCGTGSPCIAADFGPTQSDFYWSSSTYQGDSSYAWGVYFDEGGTVSGAKTFGFYVRAVRTGS